LKQINLAANWTLEDFKDLSIFDHGVNNTMSGVIGSKQDALEIQRAMQNFIKEKLKVDMKK